MNTAPTLLLILEHIHAHNYAAACHLIDQLDAHARALLALGAITMLDQLLDIHHPHGADRDDVLRTMRAYAAQTMDTTS